MDTHAAQSVQHGGAGDGTAGQGMAQQEGLCLLASASQETQGENAKGSSH